VKGLRVLLVAGALAGCAGDSASSYVIASVAPRGEAYGVMSQQGVELAVEVINKRGGIRSRPLELVTEDDEGTGAKAAEVAEKLVANDDVLAVVGHANSSATVAAARVYDGHVAAVSPSASSPEITGLSRWLFRVIPSDSVNGQDLARFANALGHDRAAILYENNSYGRGLADSFLRAFRGEITAVDPIAVDGQEVAPYIAYLRAYDPGLVFVAGSEASGLAVLREARRQQLAATFLGGDGWTGITSDSAAAEGAYVGAPFSADDPRREVQEFVRLFRSKFSRAPNSFAALSYDATMVVALAIEKAGADREGIRDALGALEESTAYAGITGRIAFRATGDVIGKPMVMTRARRGELAVVHAEGKR
jgi:branched-chain amino acid transport system substrate-binding protein